MHAHVQEYPSRPQFFNLNFVEEQENGARAKSNSTSRYRDDLFNIDNSYIESMVNQIYPPELKLNKAYASDTQAPFLDLHLSAFMSGILLYGKQEQVIICLLKWSFNQRRVV